MSEKLTKKQKKKIKAKQKQQQNSQQIQKPQKKQPPMPKVQLTHHKIPRISTKPQKATNQVLQGQSIKPQMLANMPISTIVLVRNKKIQPLKLQILQVLNKDKKVTIIAEDQQICKAISAVQMIKREMPGKLTQDALLGLSQQNRPAFQIDLYIPKKDGGEG